MLNILINENLIEVMYYLNNKDSCNFISTCKQLKNFFYKFGYIKDISLKPLLKPNLYDFFLICAQNINTLRSIYVSNINNPHLWIPSKWPKIVRFYYCNITDKIDPPISHTQEILIIQHEIINNVRSEKQLNLKINWKKFPKLKKLTLKVFNVNIDEIKENKNIEKNIILFKNF
jgi:hypothetical protein